jgi:hypothetical protein
MDEGGFYPQLFHGLPLPDGTVRPALGDRLVRQLLANLGATDYEIADSTDGYWGVRAGLAVIVRPSDYELTVPEFLGAVGHEVGSHLLERLNGDRQPLRLLSSGLAGYEKGNEGRAILREQVAYESWDDFASRWRWYEVLRRHIAISLAVGLGPRSLDFGGIFKAMYDLDLLWIRAHAAPGQAVDNDEVRATTWELLVRVFKGTDGGGAYHKDIVYLEGNVACWRLAAESPDAIRIGDLGKIDVANASHVTLVASLH